MSMSKGSVMSVLQYVQTVKMYFGLVLSCHSDIAPLRTSIDPP